ELAAGPQYYWVYESFAGDPEKAESPTTGQFITHSRSDYKYPRTLDTRNESGRFEIVSKVADVYTRRVHPTHPFDVVGWRGDYLPYRFAVEDVRPLVADRSHVPPSGHTIFKLPGCYICIFTVRSVEKEGMWLPFFHKNLDYLETLGYHFGDFFSGGGVVREGMVTLHPVGLPHGPKPASLKAFLDGKNPGVHNEVGIMADLANPTEISAFALSLSTPDYMAAWSAYTTDPRFVHRPDRRVEFAPKFGASPLYEHHTTSVVFRDPPDHTRIRRLFAPAFTPKALAALEPRVVRFVDGLLDRAAARGGMDVVDDFAAALPVQLIGDMLGVPQAERAPLRAWSLAILGALEPEPGPERLEAGSRAVEEFKDYLRRLIADRRRRPSTDPGEILSALLAAEDAGDRLTELEPCTSASFS